MKFKKMAINSFRGKSIDPMTTIAIVSGFAVGAVIGALFATKKGRQIKKQFVVYAGNLIDHLKGNSATKAQAKLGGLISDVRSHVKKNAEGLLAPPHLLTAIS
jgi:hypothetical protein